MHLLGRHHVNSGVAVFDWVGTGVSFRISQENETRQAAVRVDMDGNGARFVIIKQGNEIKDLFTSKGRRAYDLGVEVQGGDVVTLMKSSEAERVSLYGVSLDGLGLASWSQASQRRIDVYGDSDTAGYGVDGKWWWPSCGFRAEKYNNFAHGWTLNAASALQAELHVQAISGIGVIKNAGGSTSRTMTQLLGRTLHTVDADDYDGSSWPPSLIVFYIGSNDFVNFANPSKDEFIAAYKDMVARILAPFGSGAPPVVHVCGEQKTPCEWIEGFAKSTGNVFTRTGPNAGGIPSGCMGHRDVRQQKTLAERLTPVFATAAGWSA